MPTKQPLTAEDYELAAAILSTGVANIRAVCEVESGGRGFTVDGRCIIRFEPHLFSKYTKRVFDLSHPLLSFQPWQPGYPKGVDHSWKLFKEAAALNPNAAVMSTSWGAPQILGLNFAACGCANLGEFVQRMEHSEQEQLLMFCELLLDWGLADELQRRDWKTFARVYNGVGFRRNRYDEKLEAAYRKWGKVYPN
ncbi:DUF3380 domain-containing protein [Fibrisoma montanum]|uniref:DUF3380 domain-containing protein n=1 Tax=Fibrisoma montanum TaxID=2305895 RepID=A0A418M3L6_9BACT|nr:N-acetylmuramidase family protein [Fibrisoma montanum]RIV20358.1 DUF3380 domain-containing protein [Fibrisoma montanum]